MLVLLNFHPEFLGCGFDTLPRCVLFSLGHPGNLIETRDGVAHVGGIFQRFLALFREGELGGGDLVALGFGEFAHAQLLSK